MSNLTPTWLPHSPRQLDQSLAPHNSSSNTLSNSNQQTPVAGHLTYHTSSYQSSPFATIFLSRPQAIGQQRTSSVNRSLENFIKEFTEHQIRQQQLRAQQQQQQQVLKAPPAQSELIQFLAYLQRRERGSERAQRQQQLQRFQQPAHSHSMSCLHTSSDDVFASSPLFDPVDDFNKSSHSDMPPLLPAQSADDPAFIGWDAPRVTSDLLTSPLWTDPSPVLTDNNSFDTESCEPSPLLVDDLEGPSSEVAHMPLFGDMTLFSPHLRAEGSFDAQTSCSAVGVAVGVAVNAPAAMTNFSLFPESTAPASPPRAQIAFNAATTESAEKPAMILLRALQEAAAQRQSQTPVNMASLKLISSPPACLAVAAQDISSEDGAVVARKPPLMHSATEPLLSVTEAEKSTGASAGLPEATGCGASSSRDASLSKSRCRRGIKRRLGVDDLLPLDAPIQSRNYLAPSSTSRKDFFEDGSARDRDYDNGPTAEDVAAIAAEADPLKAKRLSNTLAARRSRHRKAQERAELEGTIDELRAELAAYKKMLQSTEEERAALGERLKKCKCQ